MEVIGEERPSIDGEGTLLGEGGQAGKEIVLILVVEEDLPPFHPPTDDMM